MAWALVLVLASVDLLASWLDVRCVTSSPLDPFVAQMNSTCAMDWDLVDALVPGWDANYNNTNLLGAF